TSITGCDCRSTWKYGSKFASYCGSPNGSSPLWCQVTSSCPQYDSAPYQYCDSSLTIDYCGADSGRDPEDLRCTSQLRKGYLWNHLITNLTLAVQVLPTYPRRGFHPFLRLRHYRPLPLPHLHAPVLRFFPPHCRHSLPRLCHQVRLLFHHHLRLRHYHLHLPAYHPRSRQLQAFLRPRHHSTSHRCRPETRNPHHLSHSFRRPVHSHLPIHYRPHRHRSHSFRRPVHSHLPIHYRPHRHLSHSFRRPVHSHLPIHYRPLRRHFHPALSLQLPSPDRPPPNLFPHHPRPVHNPQY
ncbi:hypothetical protein Vretifemale_9487, partial [Volvox reticuliferus]